MTKQKLSKHQIFMLNKISNGWNFIMDRSKHSLTTNKNASWVTYWSLRRRGLVNPSCILTEEGRKVLQGIKKP